MNRLFQTTLLGAGLLLASLATGCSSTIESDDLRADWTPELQSTTKGEEQFANFRSIHRHNNWRQIHDDWAMIWLEDRNMRLTRYTLP